MYYKKCFVNSKYKDFLIKRKNNEIKVLRLSVLYALNIKIKLDRRINLFKKSYIKKDRNKSGLFLDTYLSLICGYFAETNFKLTPIPVFICLTLVIAIVLRFLAPLKKNSTPSEVFLIGITILLFILLLSKFSYNFLKILVSSMERFDFEFRMFSSGLFDSSLFEPYFLFGIF